MDLPVQQRMAQPQRLHIHLIRWLMEQVLHTFHLILRLLMRQAQLYLKAPIQQLAHRMFHSTLQLMLVAIRRLHI